MKTTYRLRLFVGAMLFLAIAVAAAIGSFFDGGSLTVAYAASDSDLTPEQQLEQEVEQGIDRLISGELEAFYAALEQKDSPTFGALLRAVIDGDFGASGAERFRLILSAFLPDFKTVLASVASIVMLGVLYAVLRQLNSGFIKESTSKVVYFAVFGAVLAILTSIVIGAVSAADRVIDTASNAVNLFFPVLITLITAIGGGGTAGIFQTAGASVANLAAGTIKTVVMPLFFASVVFTVIGSISPNVSLNKLSKAAKSLANWILGGLFGMIASFSALQGIVGVGIDSIGIRTAKFALSSYVPILGGYLSDGFDIVMAGSLVLKNAFGFSAVVVLLGLTASSIVGVAVTGLVLRFAGGILQPLGDDRISGLLDSVGKSLNILVAMMAGMVFLICFLLVLMISAFNGGAL